MDNLVLNTQRLARVDEVAAIKTLAARAGLLDVRDNGLCLVIHARATDVLLGTVENLNELGLGRMKNLVPSAKGFDLYIVVTE